MPEIERLKIHPRVCASTEAIVICFDHLTATATGFVQTRCFLDYTSMAEQEEFGRENEDSPAIGTNAQHR
jgi:hypothetical protein